MSEPAWVPLGAAGIPQSFFAIDFRNPQAGANVGNVYPAINALTTYEQWVWAFRQDVTGFLYGVCRIPELAVFTNAEVDIELAASVAGITQMSVYVSAIGDGESLNPAAWQAGPITQVVSLSAGRIRKKSVHAIPSAIVAAGDLVLVGISHDGTAGPDTLAAQTELVAGYIAIS